MTERSYPVSAPLRFCEYCKSWQSKPCGDGCVWLPTFPTFEQVHGVAQCSPDPTSEAMRKAIRGLCIELEGVWDAFEYGLRAEISNTNYVLIRDKIEEARHALLLPSIHGNTP